MKKIYNIYLKLVLIVFVLSTVTLSATLILNNILPLKYLIPIILVLFIITILFVILMLKVKFKWLISIIAIIFILFFTFLQVLFNRTIDFIGTVIDDGKLMENYSVIVLKNFSDKIEDVNVLGYYVQENQSVKLALELLSGKVDTTNIESENIEILLNGLYSGDVDAIILEDGYYKIYSEESENFKNDTKVIYTFTVEKQSEQIEKQVDTIKQPFNIYISGIDTYGDISSVSRSDVNIIATINPNTNKILLTTIPRDYYVQLDGTTGLKDKLTHAGIYGIEKSVKTIENLLDIDINYYIKINFSSVERIVDALGGVDVYSKYSFVGHRGSSFISGYNTVNGVKALEFARTRKTVTGGDRTRGMNQEALIEALINKMCSKEILVRYSSLLDSLEGSFVTNLSQEEITGIIKNQIDEMPSWSVESISVDGYDSHQYTYSYGGRELFVIIPNQSTIDYFHERFYDTIS